MRFASFAVAALALGATAGAAQAQSPVPFSVEARANAALPTGSFAEGVDAGIGFGVSAAVGVTPGLGVYGGYSRTEFGLTGREGNAVDSGFAAGVTAALPAAPALSPWVGAGALFHQLDIDGTSEGSVGFEVGGGVAVPLGQRVRVTPGIGYRQYGAGDHGTVSYVAAGVGLNVAF
jgi:opacity protein-like surface antigen